MNDSGTYTSFGDTQGKDESYKDDVNLSKTQFYQRKSDSGYRKRESSGYDRRDNKDYFRRSDSSFTSLVLPEEFPDPEYQKFYTMQSENVVFEKVNEIDDDLFKMADEYALGHCVAADMRMGSGIAVNFRWVVEIKSNIFCYGALNLDDFSMIIFKVNKQ